MLIIEDAHTASQVLDLVAGQFAQDLCESHLDFLREEGKLFMECAYSF